MSNPFLRTDTNQSVNITVDGKSPSIFNGNITVNLKDLPDTHIVSPTSGNVLFYNGGTWINSNVSDVIPIPYLATDHDVTLTGLQNNDVLTYNSSTALWNNKSVLKCKQYPNIVRK